MEKKCHTAKALIISNQKKEILFVGNSYYGRCHDYTILKEEFDPKKGVGVDKNEVWVGLGFLGIQKDYCDSVKSQIKNLKEEG